MTELGIYVPVEVPDPLWGVDLANHILPGSAIVGVLLVNTSVLIDFEGDKYGGKPPGESLHDRYRYNLARAAGRHVERYPTVARMLVSSHSVVRVGSFDYTRLLNEGYRAGGLLDIEDPDLLTKWIDKYESASRR